MHSSGEHCIYLRYCAETTEPESTGPSPGSTAALLALIPFEFDLDSIQNFAYSPRLLPVSGPEL